MNRDLRLALMAGIDIPVPELQITIHQPVIKDIAYMGEQEFFMAMQYLCVDKEVLIQDKNLLESFSNFQVLMKVLGQSQDKNKKQKMIQTLLLLLFPDRDSLILPSSITLTAKGLTPIVIDDNNFEILQDYLKIILCAQSMFQGENIVYNPVNAAAKAIADKLMAGRIKAAQLKGDGNKNESVLTRYVSVLTVGLNSMNLDSCLNLTLFQIFDLIERYTAYIEWDTDLRVRLAGGKPDKPVESWMRDMHDINNQKPSPPPIEKSTPLVKGATFKPGIGWAKT